MSGYVSLTHVVKLTVVTAMLFILLLLNKEEVYAQAVPVTSTVPISQGLPISITASSITNPDEVAATDAYSATAYYLPVGFSKTTFFLQLSQNADVSIWINMQKYGEYPDVRNLAITMTGAPRWYAVYYYVNFGNGNVVDELFSIQIIPPPTLDKPLECWVGQICSFKLHLLSEWPEGSELKMAGFGGGSLISAELEDDRKTYAITFRPGSESEKIGIELESAPYTSTAFEILFTTNNAVATLFTTPVMGGNFVTN